MKVFTLMSISSNSDCVGAQLIDEKKLLPLIQNLLKHFIFSEGHYILQQTIFCPSKCLHTQKLINITLPGN